MKVAAKEVAAGLGLAGIGVVVGLAVVLVQGVGGLPEPALSSYVWRGMDPWEGQYCEPWFALHPGWHPCWHDDEEGDYTAIDYNWGSSPGDDAGKAVYLDYTGQGQLLKIMPYEGYCTGVRVEIYNGSYDPANYKGDIHYLHIDPNDYWLGKEVPSLQVIWIGNVLDYGEEDPDCWWEGPHLHQSANRAYWTPFYTNGYENPSQAELWEHAILWDPTDDSDGDWWTDGAEVFMGTDTEDVCPDNSTPNNERGGAYSEPLSPWPPDFNDTGKVTSADAVAFRQHYPPLGGTYHHRYDLNANGAITSGDLVLFKKYYQMSCTVGD